MSIYFRNLISIDNNGYIYSIDKMKIKCRITPDFFSKKISSRIDITPDVERWTSTKLGLFKYNYRVVVDDEDNSFWIGFIANSELYGKNKTSGSVNNPKNKFNLSIEFNPNKIKDNKLLMYLLSLDFETVLQQPINWSVVSCDFAFDVNCNILSLTGFDKSRKKCLNTYDEGGDNKTYYLGQGNNRVKIYNKTIESNLDYDLTRFELSHNLNDLDIKDFFRFRKELKLDNLFPKMFMQEYQMDFKELEEDSTFKAILFAVNNGYPLHELTKYQRTKIKNYLQEKKPITLDYTNFDKALTSTLAFYFSQYICL